MKKGDIGYIIENGNRITQVTIISPGEFCLCKLKSGGAIRLRCSRIFATEEGAKKEMKKMSDFKRMWNRYNPI